MKRISTKPQRVAQLLLVAGRAQIHQRTLMMYVDPFSHRTLL
jgi:hypothetical protein